MKKIYYVGILTSLIFFSCKENKGSNQKEKVEITEIVEKISIEAIINIPKDFSKSYDIKQEEDISYGEVKRIQLRITIPNGLDKVTVENNIKHSVIESYKKVKPDGISILVYENGDNIESAFSVAKGDFAPNGKWEDIKNGVSLENYKLNIVLNEPYFKPKETTPEKNASVILFKSEEYNRTKKAFVKANSVPLSNSAREWTDDKIIVKVPNNTKGKIIDIYKEKIIGGSEIIRYKVEVKYKGKTYEGWLHSDEIKK
ncbi:hypothetical protein I2486_21200 [Cellulophaga sp. E16_2]|uniref:hypothetical protein n=1 Tax=Cellulophaga sp. E16_2 TaxID=2789297 RepID=UPI001A9301D6|nr:hypothetical protein [Cellulophaga sp. E16_2]MBO0593929.1 hypothetical protein [Cellulophaga sp. E16_2]